MENFNCVEFAHQLLGSVGYQNVQSQAETLISASNDGLLIQSLVDVFIEIERKIGLNEQVNDVAVAIIKVLSGKVLLKAKELIGHGKWKFEAQGRFNIPEHERNLRMKAASVVGIEKYYTLGWFRIAELVKASKRSKSPDPFKEIVDNISYTINPHDPDDFEIFTWLVKAYVIRNSFSAGLKRKIKFEQVVDAVECEVKFDKKFIDRLENSNRPDVTLYNYIDFETMGVAPCNRRNTTNKKRELSTTINKLCYFGMMVTDKIDPYLEKVSLDQLDECFNVVCEMLYFKNRQMGY